MINTGFLVTKDYKRCSIRISVQEADFTQEIAKASVNQNEIGAEVNFIGRVRASEPRVSSSIASSSASLSETANSEILKYLQLEHYAAMTENTLVDICQQAVDRWQPSSIEVVHRVGKLSVGEPIVCVYVATQHRKQAFEACEFIMDFLKTSAPFWKKAVYESGDEQWIQQKTTDHQATKRW